MVRYADDAVILCKTKELAEEAYLVAKTILEEELRLRMHPEKTKVVHFDEGFRFLGFDFWKDYLIVPDTKVEKYKDKVRNITHRQQGNNLQEMIKKLNEVARGFVKLFRHRECKQEVSMFGQMDAYEGASFHTQKEIYGF
ncbi:reverse transcriptase domain-containing protein [Paenibacillus hexagrammi]|uniref:reverse transcriptase domain-containing protein n=1 Tax=Paenibacillus hexagrammi TaxID=2908839 RepID=UPI003313061B